MSHPLGAVVGRFPIGGGQVGVALHELGLESDVDARPVAARWEEVVAVRVSLGTTSFVGGRLSGQKLHMNRVEVRLAGGEVLKFHDTRERSPLPALGAALCERTYRLRFARRDEELRRAGVALFTQAQPDPREPRWARLSAGGIEVSLGDGRLVSLAIPQLAGYCVRNGFCSFDADPARPALVASIALGAIEDADVFLALLATLAPGKDLAVTPYRVRPRGPSAATVDPAASTDRPLRTLALLVGAGTLLLGLLVLGMYLGRSKPKPRESAASGPSLISVIESEKSTLSQSPVPDQPLAAACASVHPDPEKLFVVLFADPQGVTAPANTFGNFVPRGASWGERSQYYGSLSDPGHVVLARVLAGSSVVADGRSQVRAAVRVLDGAGAHARLCEGVVEGSWTHSSRGGPNEYFDVPGIMETVFASLGGFAGRESRLIDFSPGPPPAPSARPGKPSKPRRP